MNQLRSTKAGVNNSSGVTREVSSFLGIRYAELSHGRRFDQPIPVELTDQLTEQASFFTTGDIPVFPQLPFRLAPFLGVPAGDYPQCDDAFFLNVSVPANAADVPVLVFVHGGAWVSGAGTYGWYRGERLAAEGICVVTVNYRLHAGGLLTEDSPHLPLEDLTLALRWVQQNIDRFGGDPANVTLAGQSAGGWYVHALAQDQGLQGTFRRIALWSMATRTPWPSQLMSSIVEGVRERLGTDDLATPRSRLLMATALSVSAHCRDEYFGPAHLGYSPPALLPAVAPNLAADFLDPEKSAAKLIVDQVLLRVTTHETGIFFADSDREMNATHAQADQLLEEWVPAEDRALIPAHFWQAMTGTGHTPFQRVRAISSWMQFQRLAYQLAGTYAQAGKRVQLHEFTFTSPNQALGASHCFDLPFQFNNRDQWSTAPMLNEIPNTDFDRAGHGAVQDLLRFMTS